MPPTDDKGRIPDEKRYDGPRYADYEYDDETSQFDPRGRWQGGSECYIATYRCRVPKGLLKDGKERALEDWIVNHSERGIWR